MLQATDASNGRRATFRTPLVALHAQLIFSLTRDWQISELVLDRSSHSSAIVSEPKIQVPEAGTVIPEQEPLGARHTSIADAAAKQAEKSQNCKFDEG